MADEPERRVVGAILAELERQSAENEYPWLGRVDGGCLHIDGTLDLYLLARAVIAEIKENPL